MSIKLGQYNQLFVLKSNEHGLYLGERESSPPHDRILLPLRYASSNLAIGDKIEVFVYLDSEDRPIATTETPKAQVGKFQLLKCLEVNKVGAFMDWGLPKDLLAPYGQQFKPMQAGRSYLVYLYIDNASQRIVATSKLDRYLDKTPTFYKKRQAVDLIIRRKTDLGYLAIVNHQHSGMIFKDQTVTPLKVGQSLQGFIKELRPDGKIHLALSKGAIQDKDRLAGDVINELKKQRGYLPLNDKSRPEDIYRTFKVSKAVFKRTIGKLYKERKIRIEADGIYLV
ncbi:S1 RNA-binding domain-containing protein [Kangiella sp. TOML190]|uniref:CvfB family protein n=1 Tax=Kangiella sp. TOML190 TaxID=2931351 RepID=UPI0020423E35|nr:S1-like domain-containing RNA-binding protein [Kangiella sp. TOML190]